MSRFRPAFLAVVVSLTPFTAGAQHPTEKASSKVAVPSGNAIPASAATGHSALLGANATSCTSMSPLGSAHRIFPETAGPGFASFVDPTVRVQSGERVLVGCRSFIGPFASLDGSLGPIAIGDGTNIQDNVLVSGKLVILGDNVIIAHGATLSGTVTIGAPHGKPAFVGFNSHIDGGTVEPDAMVTHLVRVSPGIVIHAGMKILPGKWIKTQREADDTTLGKAVRMNAADREFMAGVLHVNLALSAGYAELQHSAPAQLDGAGRDPGHSDFNHDSDMPEFAGRPESHPEFRNRMIGSVHMADSFAALVLKLGQQISIRADEGEHFRFGVVGHFQDRVTFHALEHSDIEVGGNSTLGYHVVVHGGADDGSEPHDVMRIGDDVTVRDWAVVFRSKIGAGSTIGVRAYVDGCHLPAGSIVPDRAIMVKDKLIGYVEW